MSYPYSRIYTGYVRFYTLSDLSGNIFYVGATSKTIKQRLAGHISEAKSSNRISVNVKKCDLIKSLNYQIVITIIDIKPTVSRNEKTLVFSQKEHEEYWIKKYRDLGYDLLNRTEGNAHRKDIKEAIGDSCMNTDKGIVKVAQS